MLATILYLKLITVPIYYVQHTFMHKLNINIIFKFHFNINFKTLKIILNRIFIKKNTNQEYKEHFQPHIFQRKL